MGIDLSSAEARRLALGALGFGAKRPARAGIAHVRATASRLGAIQVDSVNVLARAHYLPTFSRYGAYPMSALDDLAHGKRELFEYWGHAACFLPIDLYPLMRWRMDGQIEAWSGLDAKRKAYIEAVYREVVERGPISAGELSIAGKSTGPWWGWSDGKQAMEFLFRQGRVAVAGRRNFERLYDLPDRVLPASVLQAAAVAARDAKKALLVRAAARDGRRDREGHHAILSRRRMVGSPGSGRAASAGEELSRCSTSSWKTDASSARASRDGSSLAYVVPGVRIPRSVDARAIVSPFDPLMWERKWTKSVFDFDYQIEIYVPAPKRVYGYYVLPFLMGDRFAARVDLKADRKASTLIVHAAYVEEGFDAGEVAAALADELRSMATWLSLESFAVGRKGNLAQALKRAI